MTSTKVSSRGLYGMAILGTAAGLILGVSGTMIATGGEDGDCRAAIEEADNLLSINAEAVETMASMIGTNDIGTLQSGVDTLNRLTVELDASKWVEYRELCLG